MHCFHSKVFKPSTLSFPTRLLTHVSQINLDKFDGSHTQTYTPSSGDKNDEIIEKKMFAEERDYFYGLTEETTELIFDESINNSDLPASMSAGIHTRDKLNSHGRRLVHWLII